MDTDLVRILADWLANATHGFNAGLAAVPIDVDVTRAASVTLFDESRHPEAARMQAPDTLPALVVNLVGGSDQAPVALQPYPGDLEVPVLIRHIVRVTDTDDGLAALSQGRRAIRRSIGRLWTVSGNEAARSRNQTQLYSLRSYRADVFRGNEDSILTMAHQYTMSVRDLWALA